MARVSVIMPAYNASQTIGRALESLRNQTYQDIEIIIINDGSTDETLEVVQEIARLDSRIVIVNQSNSGPGFARNAGLNKAGGEFVYFMDSDDTIDADLIYKCVDYMIDSNLDLLVFGLSMIDASGRVVEKMSFNSCFVTNRDDLAANYTSLFLNVRHGNGFLWNKFYRHAIIEDNSIRFGKDSLMEDELFNLDYIRHVSRCRFVEEAFYNYFWTEPTSIRSKYNPTYLGTIKKVYDAFMSLKNELRIKDEDFDKVVISRTWNGLIVHLYTNLSKYNPPMTPLDMINSFKQVSMNSTFQNVARFRFNMGELSVLEECLFYSIKWNSAVLFLFSLWIYHALQPIKLFIQNHV